MGQFRAHQQKHNYFRSQLHCFFFSAVFIRSVQGTAGSFFPKECSFLLLSLRLSASSLSCDVTCRSSHQVAWQPSAHVFVGLACICILFTQYPHSMMEKNSAFKDLQKEYKKRENQAVMNAFKILMALATVSAIT